MIGYPRATPFGELEVRLDSCDGAVLTRLPLPAGDALGTRLNLRGDLPAQSGQHDLCMRFTAPSNGPLYAIGTVQLIPTAKPAVSHLSSGKTEP